MPLLNLDGVVCFGRVGFSSQLAAACAEAGVSISLMSPHGRFRAAVVGFSPGNVLLRRQQYRAADDPEATARIARNCISGKIANCRSVLLRAARDAKDEDRSSRLKLSAKHLAPILRRVAKADDADSVRGYEGESASKYFSSFGDLTSVDAFQMKGRSRLWIPSMHCCHFSMPCWPTTLAVPAKHVGSTQQLGSCIEIAPVDQVAHWI